MKRLHSLSLRYQGERVRHMLIKEIEDLSSLAFGAAQDEIDLFSKVPSRIADKISIMNDFHFSEAGVAFSYSDSIFFIEK